MTDLEEKTSPTSRKPILDAIGGLPHFARYPLIVVVLIAALSAGQVSNLKTPTCDPITSESILPNNQPKPVPSIRKSVKSDAGFEGCLCFHPSHAKWQILPVDEGFQVGHNLTRNPSCIVTKKWDWHSASC